MLLEEANINVADLQARFDPDGEGSYKERAALEHKLCFTN